MANVALSILRCYVGLLWCCVLRLLRFIAGLALLALFIYAAVTVPLGQRTFWGHLRAIAGAPETRDLVDGVKQKAGEIIHREAGAPERPASPGSSSAGAVADPGQTSGGQERGDSLTAAERKVLRRLIREKMGRGEQRSGRADPAKPEMKAPAKGDATKAGARVAEREAEREAEKSRARPRSSAEERPARKK